MVFSKRGPPSAVGLRPMGKKKKSLFERLTRKAPRNLPGFSYFESKA
jgi:hypothetical protein